MTVIVGHARDKYVSALKLASSAAHGWNDLLVERWSHVPGHVADTQPVVTEVAILLSGLLNVRRRGDGRRQQHDASPGTIWLCPAGIDEDQIHATGDPFECLHIFLPAAPLASTMLEDFDLDPGITELHYDGGFKDPLIEQLGFVMARELQDPSEACSLLVDSLRLAMSAHIVRNHSSASTRSPSMVRAAGELSAPRLNRVLDYIEEHLPTALHLNELAAQAYLSPFHFARAFKVTTGITPHAYLVERRVARARRLVLDSALRLDVIASQTGFSSQAQMTKVFSRVLGVTPGVIRRSA